MILVILSGSIGHEYDLAHIFILVISGYQMDDKSSGKLYGTITKCCNVEAMDFFKVQGDHV